MLTPMLAEMSGSIHVGLAGLGSAIGVGLVGMKASEAVGRNPDDFLLALSEAGKADYLVTGDKSGLLALEHHKGTRIVSARAFAALFG